MDPRDLLKEPLQLQDIFTEKDKIKSPWELSEVLRKKTILVHSKSFPKIDKTYIYNPKRGIYEEYTANELILCVTQILEGSKISASMHHIKLMVESIKYHLNAEFGHPEFNKEYLVFDNGLFQMETGELVDWTPTVFITSRMEGIWPTEYKEPKEFFRFMNTFCGGDVQRVNFLRVVAWAALTGYTWAQFFVVMQGPGAGGKSTFGGILEAVLGEEYCVVTTYRELSRSPFETAALRGKKLILFNDVDHCTGDLSLLKQLVGGDTIRGREKYKMSNEDFKVEALILMATNHSIFQNDTGHALSRRMRLFPATNIIPAGERKDLIRRTRDGYSGLLAKEIPHIRRWVYYTKQELSRATDYLHLTSVMVPSLATTTEEAKEEMNPLLCWIKEELEEGKGAYVGFKMRYDAKNTLEISRRKLLYPTYRIWCERRDMSPLGHKRFANELIWNLKSLGFRVEKTRRNEGMFISGVTIKENVFNHDNFYGGPLQLSNESPSEPNLPETYIPPEINKQHPYLIPDLYNCYKSKLLKDPLKLQLNKISKGLNLDIDKLVNLYFEGVPNPSQAYSDRMRLVLYKGAQNIKSFGAIPYTYKSMGTSPRILPAGYGSSMNSTKRILRQEVYYHLGKSLNEDNKVIMDLDLRSCYTSIVIGLYPKPLEALQIAIEGEGLWKYVYKEFERNGKADVYKKGPVKVCVYSSFFGGGSKAMIEGILDQFRRDGGLTQVQFKNLQEYEYFHTIAREVAKEMQNSAVITDLRSISNTIKDTYMNDFLIGPTGHGYKVTEDSFKTAYPNYLQSFEFALLADTTLRVMEEFKEVVLIGHYHDGNVLIVPKDDIDPFLQRFSEKLEQLGRSLGLSYPQKIEVKKIYE